MTWRWARRVSEREGQAKVLRAKVEQVEREKRELQTRISQGSQGGMAAFQAQELQRQLDIARQNLAHKDQEVCVLVQIVSSRLFTVALRAAAAMRPHGSAAGGPCILKEKALN